MFSLQSHYHKLGTEILGSKAIINVANKSLPQKYYHKLFPNQKIKHAIINVANK